MTAAGNVRPAAGRAAPAVVVNRTPAAAAVLVRPAAIEANVRHLAALANGAELCAVVKAGGYGHGAPAASVAAVSAGASWLAVATANEAAEIAGIRSRDGGSSGRPAVLMLSELSPSQLSGAVRLCPEQVRFTVASAEGIRALASAGGPPRRVHLKIDTGMHRMGAAAGELGVVAGALRSAAPRLRLEAAWTHLAVADAPDDPFTAEQMQRFDVAVAGLERLGITVPMTHAANSAGLIAHPDTRRDLVRAGIACYGVPPSAELEGRANEPYRLEPALSLVSRVSALRDVAAGESVSYGRCWYAEQPTRVATVSIGFADGVRRDSGASGVEVLLRGRRCRIVGAVTMDQLMVVPHPAIADAVAVDDEVVLIGRQGSEEVTATEVAQRLGTIAYEVLTGISSRVPRLVV